MSQGTVSKKARFKWSADMNSHLYRAYLHITEMETNTTSYGRRLYDEMMRRFPELRGKTIQNILDQRRQLFIKQRLPVHETQRIRREVAEELGMIAVEQEDDPPGEQQPQQEDMTTDNEQRVVCRNLQKNIILYAGTDPLRRPKIPRLKTRKDTNKTLARVNEALDMNIKNCNEITSLHDHIYAAAITTLELHNQKLITSESNNDRRRTETPPWETRLIRKIDSARKEIGILTQHLSNTKHRQKTHQKANDIINRYKNNVNNNTQEILDYLKQRLKIYANRLRRYRRSHKRRIDNRLFDSNQKAFYRNIQATPTEERNNDFPEVEDVRQFWSKIWEIPAIHKNNGEWIRQEKRRTDKTPIMPSQRISTAEVKEILKGSLNWKAAGPDKIHNYWYKKFSCTHEKIAVVLNNMLQNPESTPDFITRGSTYMIPKTMPAVANPSKYRPITCLPTIYKILTGILANRVYKHMITHKLLAEEQKGCRKQFQGCRDQLIIDAIITEGVKRDEEDLHTAFIDYQKAFDSVPHSWLLESLNIYKVDPQITKLLETMMSRWETNIIINQNHINIKIKRGIFQGDALSALWFCIALNPLSTALNNRGNGYYMHNTQEKISHLMYMDDIKLIARTQTGLKRLLRTTEEFSNDIRMNFGLDKCRTNHIRKGKWIEAEDFTLLQRTGAGTIHAMNRHESYKYLGITQSQGIDNIKMKKELTEKLRARLKSIMKTNLSALNKAKATNAFIIPAVAYSFGILKWTPTDLEQLNRNIRVAYTRNRAHHPRACKERFHLPRSYGGRGILDLRIRHQEQIEQLRNYFFKKAEDSNLYRAIVNSDRNLTPLNLGTRHLNVDNQHSYAKLKDRWMEKELHGRYPNLLQQPHIDKQATIAWLSLGNLFPETEGFMCAIQDQVIPTRSYLKYIVKDPTIPTSECRLCGGHNENIEHIISSCKSLASKDYTERHNNVARILHGEIAVKYGCLEEAPPYYKYTPESIVENDVCRIYWDRDLQTDRTIQHNRPDIVVLDKKENIMYLIDVAIPAPVNVDKKHTEKIEKYLPLAYEMKEIWDLREVKIIPIIVGATGEIPKRLSRKLEQLGLPIKLQLQMQKSVILSTCNIVRKVLNITI